MLILIMIGDSMSGMPKISNADLKKLTKRIKPVIRIGRGKDLCYIEEGDPINSAFTYSPKLTQIAYDINQKPYKIIKTIHEPNGVGHFAPSIAEVISQIPLEDRKRAVAFEVVHGVVAPDREHHIAETRLYEKRSTKRPTR